MPKLKLKPVHDLPFWLGMVVFAVVATPILISLFLEELFDEL